MISERTSLEGRVAVVTGGSRGIGFATGSALAAAGATLVIVARTVSELDAARLKLESSGARVRSYCGDVADRDFCFHVVRETEREFGSVDVLLNNAGIQGPIGPIEELDPELWQYTVAVDLLGPVWLMQAAIPGMKTRGRGSIINLSGGGATGPRERFTAYGAAKAALVRLTETVAVELAPFRIRVNSIAPGAANTRMLEDIESAGPRAGEKAQAEARKQRETGGADLGIVGELVVFLASDAAAGVSGRLISAVWDDWRSLRNEAIESADLFTLRRVTPTPVR